MSQDETPWRDRITYVLSEYYLVWAILIVAACAVTLRLMGQPYICSCGYVKLWHGLVDAQSSHHLFDWFTFQHFLTGMVIYGALRYAAPALPRRIAFLAAVSIEVAWEILENTPWAINQFRDTAHENYIGDSILNSLGDILAMIPGYIFAQRYPWWASVLLGVAIEIVTLIMIHDSVLINVIMLIYPFEVIREWQLAAWP